MTMMKVPAPNLVTQVSPDGLLAAATVLHQHKGDLSVASFSQMTGVDTSTARRRLAHAHRLGLAHARMIPVSGPVFRAVYNSSITAQVNFSMKNTVLDALATDPLRMLLDERGTKALERLFYLHYDWSVSTRVRRLGSIHALSDFYSTTTRDQVTFTDEYGAGSSGVVQRRPRVASVIPKDAPRWFDAPYDRNVHSADSDDMQGIRVISRDSVTIGCNIVMPSLKDLSQALRNQGQTCPTCFTTMSTAGGCFC